MGAEREVKLLPCPFCGGDSDSIVARPRHNKFHWEVRCENDSTSSPDEAYCGASLWGDTEAEAITAWNHRVDPARQGLVEALKAIEGGAPTECPEPKDGYWGNEDDCVTHGYKEGRYWAAQIARTALRNAGETI